MSSLFLSSESVAEHSCWPHCHGTTHPLDRLCSQVFSSVPPYICSGPSIQHQHGQGSILVLTNFSPGDSSLPLSMSICEKVSCPLYSMSSLTSVLSMTSTYSTRAPTSPVCPLPTSHIFFPYYFLSGRSAILSGTQLTGADHLQLSPNSSSSHTS